MGGQLVAPVELFLVTDPLKAPNKSTLSVKKINKYKLKMKITNFKKLNEYNKNFYKMLLQNIKSRM